MSNALLGAAPVFAVLMSGESSLSLSASKRVHVVTIGQPFSAKV